MGHQITLAKIKADTLDEAYDAVHCAFEESCESGNSAGYSYLESVTRVELPIHGHTTWESLENYYKNAGSLNCERREKGLREDMFKILTGLCLSKKEAPLYVSHEDEHVREIIARILVANEEHDLPKTFDELVAVFIKAITYAIDTGTPVAYLISRIENYKNAQDVSAILQCYDKHYVEFDPIGDKETFYFLCDRKM
jgi:hypothetical protein